MAMSTGSEERLDVEGHSSSDRRHRLAMVHFGHVPHRKRALPNSQTLQLLLSVWPTHNTFVLQPLRAAGLLVDTFLHTWSVPGVLVQEAVGSVLEPEAVMMVENEPSAGELCGVMQAKFPVYRWSSCGQMGALLSMERGLRLRGKAEQQRDLVYDWVMLRRLDALQYKPFSMANLVPTRLYLSNICTPRVLHMPGGQYRDDNGARITDPICTQTTDQGWVNNFSIPDFTFLSSPKIIDKLFLGSLNMTRHPKAHDFPPFVQHHFSVYGFSMHYFLRWRIRQLGLEASIARTSEMHLMDYSFARVSAFSLGQCNASGPLMPSMWWSNHLNNHSHARPSPRTRPVRESRIASTHSPASQCHVPLSFCSCRRGWSDLRGVFGLALPSLPSG